MSSETAESQRPWHGLNAGAALQRVGGRLDGLTGQEAQERLSRHGPNALPPVRSVHWSSVLADQFKGAFAILLVVAATLAIVTGDPRDGAAILAVLLLNVALGFFSELRARHAIDALRALEVARATVMRSGALVEIDARDLVPGDLINVEAGLAVPADARLVSSTELRTIEGALTGESNPVDKRSDCELEADTSLPDRRNMIYLGTSVVAGTARAVVVATGADTEVGRIGGMMGRIRVDRTPLERRLDALGTQLAAIALVVAALIVGVDLLQGIEVAEAVRTGIAVAIAAVPEGLPAVVTIAMAIGVHRMAKRQALVRRLPTIESLGSTTVICTDKTGTLTTGDMTVTHLSIAGRDIRITGTGYSPVGTFIEKDASISARTDPDVAIALRTAALANRADLTRVGDRWEIRGDPTDGALLALASKAGIHRAILLEQWPERHELPFSSERMLMATYHGSGEQMIAHVKGSPGAVLDLCDKVVTRAGVKELGADMRGELLHRNEALAAEGLRVLALAYGSVRDTGERDLTKLTFIGFAGMIDAPAPGVRETVQLLRNAGIRTIMLTGDQRRTAEAIATNLGLMTAGGETLEGKEIDRLSDAELTARAGEISACSRVSPEGKVRIVAALQRRNEIVAMLGDGVNDAAALRKADVGVAMGRRGTAVAKEAAGIVLEDDRFATIAVAVEEGRAIFDNIRKFVFYLFSCNLAELIVLLGAGVAGLPLPLLPLQILWLNLATDTFPALVLAFEPAEADVMRRPPRDVRTGILSRAMTRDAVAYSVLIAACALSAFVLSLSADNQRPNSAVTMVFMTLAFAQIFHLGNARSRAHVFAPGRAIANPLALAAVAFVILLQLLTLYIRPLRELLQLVVLGPTEWAIVIALGVIPGLAGQAVKWFHASRLPTAEVGR